MHVLYLHQYFNTPANAGSTRSYEMARRLVARGHQVDVITTDRRPNGDGGWRVTEHEGIRVHWLGVPYDNRMSYARRLQAFARFALASSVRAARLRADVVFATSTPLTIAVPGLAASHWQRKPMVFEVRDLWPELPVAMGALRNPLAVWAAEALEQVAYRGSAYVVALSPDMRDGVVRAGFPADRVHVIPNACDLDAFAVPPSAGATFRTARPWLGDRPLVVYAGTLGKINGVAYLARLAARVQETVAEARFLVVGAGAEEEVVRTEASRLGVLGKSFFMEPPMPKASVPALLSAATIPTSLFIDLPAMWANSANKFFDGLAAGRPVAINYGGWQALVLRESGAGLVLHPTDHAAASATLVHALRTPRWVDVASASARKVAREQFSRDVLAGQLEAVLERAAAGQP